MQARGYIDVQESLKRFVREEGLAEGLLLMGGALRDLQEELGSDGKPAEAFGRAANAVSKLYGESLGETTTPPEPQVYGLAELAVEYGYGGDRVGIDELLADVMIDSICPAICTSCGHITETESHQAQGYCEECKGQTVKSALVLAGII